MKKSVQSSDSIIKFPCGCEFKGKRDNGYISSLDIGLDVHDINLNCPGTWDLICSGNTVGVFQLDSNLGKGLSKDTLPTNIEELAALVSIMRPGSMDAKFEDGKSATTHFIMRKHGKEEITYINPILVNILKLTYGINVYQEQSIKIAQDVAGMTLTESDYYIRNGIGKKLADVVAEGKKKFLAGGINNGYKEEELLEIFSWIEASARYQFNKSHAVAYAIDAYKTAYLKFHLPRAFFTARLIHSKDKTEIGKFIKDAIMNKVCVLKPDIRIMNEDFLLKDKNIYFGLSRIKDIGRANFRKVLETSIESSWCNFLCVNGSKLGKSVMEALIKSGALDFYKETRNKMLMDYRQFDNLSDKQKFFIKDIRFNSLIECIDYMIEFGTGKNKPCYNQASIVKITKIKRLLENPAVSTKDTLDQIIEMEKEYLGYSITYNELEMCDTSAANMSCENVLFSKNKKNITISVNIDDVKTILTKNKDKMCFLRVSDSTASLESVIVFPSEWKLYNSKLFVGNTVTINCYKKDNSIISQKIWQI